MPTPKSEVLKNLQYERRKQVCEWLEANPGWHTIAGIGRGIGIITENIRNPVLWLERKELVLTQIHEHPRRAVCYQLARSLEDTLIELKNELDENEFRINDDLWLDQEHLDWMAKYRKKFIERRQMMNLAIPNFATEC